jgi:eukaryotic-like serine/threonine-protein kinase
VKSALPKATTLPVQGPPTDLVFCRELGYLRSSDLFRLIDQCWDAYQQMGENPVANPHSRFDVSEWLPLVE